MGRFSLSFLKPPFYIYLSAGQRAQFERTPSKTTWDVSSRAFWKRWSITPPQKLDPKLRGEHGCPLLNQETLGSRSSCPLPWYRKDWKTTSKHVRRARKGGQRTWAKKWGLRKTRTENPEQNQGQVMAGPAPQGYARANPGSVRGVLAGDAHPPRVSSSGETWCPQRALQVVVLGPQSLFQVVSRSYTH